METKLAPILPIENHDAPMSGKIVAPGTFSVCDAGRNDSWLLNSNANVNESARLYTDPFSLHQAIKGEGEPLYKSLAGRLFTQSVARGISGAAFFTAGCYMLKKWQPGEALSDQHMLGKLPQAISNIFETVLTKPVQTVIGHITSPAEAEELMRFNKYMAKPHMVEKALENGARAYTNAEVFGLKYHEEIVHRTLPFALGSTGAALMRNLVMALDPNYKKSWLHEDGIDWKDFAKSSLKQAWKIFSYDQMEDWFAAPFYTVQLRLERELYNPKNGSKDTAKWSLQNDVACSAETLHIANNTATMEGSLQNIGGRDLADRFSKYNFYTLIYRDMYNHVAHMLSNHGDISFKLPEDPLKALSHGISENAKYLTKSFIKSQIYMAPSVLAFWPQRVSVGRMNHSMVDNTSGQLITTAPTRAFDVNNPAQSFVENGVSVPHMGIAARPGDIRGGKQLYSNDQPFTLHDAGYDPYAHPKGFIDTALAPIGRVGNAYANVLDKKIAHPLADGISHLTGIEADRARLEASWLAHNFAAAQFAYPLYFEAKYEAAQMWDTPVMDAAAYRFTDGLFSLNLKEMWRGAKDIAHVITFQPVSDETAKLVGEARGPINSRYESRCLTDEKQAELRVKAQIDKEVENAKRDGIILPTTQVEAIKREGAAAALAFQKQVEKSTLTANAITPFKKKFSKEVALATPDSVIGERAAQSERLQNDSTKIDVKL